MMMMMEFLVLILNSWPSFKVAIDTLRRRISHSFAKEQFHRLLIFLVFVLVDVSYARVFRHRVICLNREYNGNLRYSAV